VLPQRHTMEPPPMRRALLILAGLAVLGGCSPTERNRVSATPPSVSYRVTGNDISQANASAAQYCQRYGAGAQYQGLQSSSSGNVAVYTCDGAPVASSGSSAAPYNAPYNSQSYAAPAAVPYAAPYGAAPATECADMLHQNRPGGADYSGPPVPGCPPTR
jgi:hypothetical protein